MSNICKICKSEMKIGWALYPWYDYVRLYFAPLGKSTKLKQCWKCTKCGHSEELANEQRTIT